MTLVFAAKLTAPSTSKATCKDTLTIMGELLCGAAYNNPNTEIECTSVCGSATFQDTATCPPTKDPSYTQDCICRNSIVSAYASCLQCQVNSQEGAADTIAYQELVEDLVSQCPGFSLSTPSITAFPTPAHTVTSTHFTTNTFTFDAPTPTSFGNGVPHSGGDDGDGDGDFNGDSTGLAIGAIIGIAVAVPLGSALIVGLLGLLCASHAKNRRKTMLEGYYRRF